LIDIVPCVHCVAALTCRCLSGVHVGVPRERRGEIWLLLVEQHQLCHDVDEPSVADAEGSEKYEDLLKRLTLHQHAILIDLGTCDCVILHCNQTITAAVI